MAGQAHRGVEYYLAVIDHVGLDKKDAAVFLRECAQIAEDLGNDRETERAFEERRALWIDSLECRIIAAFLLEDIDRQRDSARCLDFAGSAAHSLKWMKYKADLKEQAAKIYELLDDEVAAAYSYLNAADALILKGNNFRYEERIDLLMEKGMRLLRRNEDRIAPSFVEKMTNRYMKFKKGYAFSHDLLDEKAREPE